MIIQLKCNLEDYTINSYMFNKKSWSHPALTKIMRKKSSFSPNLPMIFPSAATHLIADLNFQVQPSEILIIVPEANFD